MKLFSKARFLRLQRRAKDVGSTKSQTGFTLVEIMVVLVIIGLISTFLFGKIFATGEKAKARINEMKMKTLSQKIGEYKLSYNSLPGNLLDLAQCNQVTGQGCIPLLDRDDPAMEDAWGNPFNYSAENGGRTYKIMSFGADGRPGGEGVNFDFSLEGP